MSTGRLHHSLPAPVVHAGFSVHQSKSNVLAGVQDAYWSDEEEDPECPLCLEEMDISEITFKPCVCGYQICRFCWHHIKDNLNGLCPACRRPYTDEPAEFKPIEPADHKRLTQQKKQRDRERKDLDALGRRHYANVRVVQRNVVYVVGIASRFAKEELLPTLRSSEYFGQYGRITKIILNKKRNSSTDGNPQVGLYISYYRREDAARAIAAVDGHTFPGVGKDVMRASYGTTKYCMSFLRGISCTEHGCMNLHEWGDEKDCFTKEDLTTLKHTMKSTENRSRRVAGGKASEALPRSASWGQRASTAAFSAGHSSSLTSGRNNRRGGTRQSRTTTGENAKSETRPSRSGKAAAGKAPSQTSSRPSSRPSTPANLPPRPMTPAEAKISKQKRDSRSIISHSPAPSSVGDSETGSQDVQSKSPPPSATVPSVPPGLPAVPPGLSAPPGIPGPSRPPRFDSASPQTPLLASQSSYQMSNAARALIDDVKARRKAVVSSSPSPTPFPDLDRTLAMLSGDNEESGGFTFNIDPKLANEDDATEPFPEFDAEARTPFVGTYVDAFPALRTSSQSSFMPASGLSYMHNLNRAIYDPMAVRPNSIERQSSTASSYLGSFNPFNDSVDESPAPSASSPTFADDDPSRKMSRFGFARGRRSSTATSSPMHTSTSLGNANSILDVHQSIYGSTGELSQSPAPSQWSLHGGYASASSLASPALAQAQAQVQAQTQPVYSQQPSGRFQPFDTPMNEYQLREFIHANRDPSMHGGMRNNSADQSTYSMNAAGPRSAFVDPAIMSAGRHVAPSGSAPPMDQAGYPSMDQVPAGFGPFPGLSFQAGGPMIQQHIEVGGGQDSGVQLNSIFIPIETPPSPGPLLSTSDFPALAATSTPEPASASAPPSSAVTQTDVEPSVAEEDAAARAAKVQEKAERKAAKKAVAAERAAERQRIAAEKSAAKAAEKARLAEEKKRAAELKAQQDKERAEKERIQKEKEKAEKEERERKAKEERARQAQLEKERQEERGRKEKENADKNMQKEAKKLIAAATKKVEALKSAVLEAEQEAQGKPQSVSKKPEPEPVAQVPILSKKPKKNKPVVTKVPIRVSKEEDFTGDDVSPAGVASSGPSEMPPVVTSKASSSNNSRAQSVERKSPSSLYDLFQDIHLVNQHLDLPNHVFFDPHRINPAAKMPLEYGPLVHALSALSVGGGSFANNAPSGSIDNAVSSFQQLLETLTQTISDLLRLLPRTTWDDSSSFDGVLRDMLKGEDFLDDAGEDGHANPSSNANANAGAGAGANGAQNAGSSTAANGQGKEDEVAALTLALERRARWMEVQLSKLEELHRDINNAAVKAVLSFNDAGWDRHKFLPHVGSTLKRFEGLGFLEDEDGSVRPMTADELEKKLAVAKEATVFAETEVREMMESLLQFRPDDEDL